MYRALDPDRIVATLEKLQKRIDERFPASGLTKVCGELIDIARENKQRAERIAKPNMPLRIGVLILFGSCLLLLTRIGSLIDFSKTSADSVYTVLQGIEATMNILVLMGATAIFLVSSEDRLKRRRALAALHELRAIAHVIDMHQLTKDPAMAVSVSGSSSTPSSPDRTLTQFELTRYLDYCSEMLSLTAKIAVLYAQSLPSPTVIEVVNDIERTAASLAQKIWQKIMIIESGMQHQELMAKLNAARQGDS